MSDPKQPVDRRRFIRSSAAAGAALTLSAASYGRVIGANDRLGVAFLGAGARAQAHLDIVNRLRGEGRQVVPVAVCDVWDGLEDEYDQEFNGKVTRRRYAQGLYPSARKAGLDPADRRHVVKDYRKVLELKEVDVVCVATPDHWHARMTIDAAEAGKHVYCEKPMTRTAEEAHAVVDAVTRHNVVMTVGVQSLADPTWLRAYDLIRQGKIGHVAQGQGGCYRNDARGQWRFYRLATQMNPRTVDWKLFLGSGFEVVAGVPLAPEMPFDRAAFAQWRCYWPFGGGPFTDLLVHQVTRLMAAMGLRYPGRVSGSGGLYLEYDGREVPDVGSITAEYDEGCQLQVSAATVSGYPVEEVIRGRLGTIRFVPRGLEVYADGPARAAGLPARLGDRPISPAEVVEVSKPANETVALWENFLECVRSRNRNTLSTPELGAAAVTTVTMGVQSYRTGQALFWDRGQRKFVPADASWAARWERRSQARGKPNQVPGYQPDGAGDVQPPSYMKLAGPWIDGKDPAG